ncbi:conserved hypothetical protein [Treponema pallidum subsp. pallidum str. Chicago]|nr:conserved hypothetical protein [Treponema pallidum subsp. pallidum str. Chicago]
MTATRGCGRHLQCLCHYLLAGGGTDKNRGEDVEDSADTQSEEAVRTLCAFT